MKRKCRHTPGPWLIAWNGRVKRAIYAKGHSFPLAEIRASSAISSLTADANAKLIISAPDLLELLIGELSHLDEDALACSGWSATDPRYVQLENRREKLRAVLAKAGVS
jgi:hypothetical protein